MEYELKLTRKELSIVADLVGEQQREVDFDDQPEPFQEAILSVLLKIKESVDKVTEAN